MAKMPEYHPVVGKLVTWTIRNGWRPDETMSAFQVALQFAQTHPAEASWLMTQIKSAQEAFTPDLMIESDQGGRRLYHGTRP